MLLDLLAVLILVGLVEFVLALLAVATWREKITGPHETYLFNLAQWNILVAGLAVLVVVVVEAGKLIAGPIGWALGRLA